MSRRGQSITLSLSERDKQQLMAIAAELGIMWGQRPNISKLIVAIARRQFVISPNNDWSSERIIALDSARKALIDIGKLDQAKEIAEIIANRSELNPPFRREIESFLATSQPSWRTQIDELIRQKQPFRLSYLDAGDRAAYPLGDRHWNFTVQFAKIALVEQRQYLLCRCEESQGNEDVEALKHNWTLRLDRIETAAVTEVDRVWQADLDTVAVEFYLYGGLAFAYQSKPEDIFVGEVEGGDPARRKVIRKIFNTFWFFRDIARYWQHCEIVAPEAVRSRLSQKIEQMYKKYYRQ